MGERAGQRADDLKAEPLPELHGSVIRADDEVELHRPVALGPSQRVGWVDRPRQPIVDAR